ncbi:ComEC/Rec2 family competence protein [Phorcysia thermohydrogeniphila]|uniref:ComEC/Rec2 family competence protein n=1 Tax=Phorcysia thermohydrogeniphila TaxID=936138 RepID=UPI001401FA8F|nr:ComEC/Rec2 family competence protein [Phorcysia thermohydrogeniphila]
MFFLAFFSLFRPIASPDRVVWISERSENLKLALLENGKRVRLRDDVKIGDIVDGSGHLLTEGNRLYRFLPNLRHSLYRKVEENVDYPISTVVGAVTLGVRYELPYAVKGYFLLSGLYPFLAISGLHVGIVIGALAGLLKLLKVKRPLTKATLSILPLMPLTGLPPSAVRAYLFMLFISLGIENYRKVSPLYLLSVVFLVAVITSGISLSAVLSFSAVAGILLLSSSGGSRITKLLKVSIAPFLFTLPVVLYTFGTVNFLSPINSIIAGFLFSPFLILSFLSEVTLFKLDFLVRALEFAGFYFLKVSQFLFNLTKSFVFYFKVPFWLSGVCMVLMLTLILAGRRNLLLVPPVLLLAYALFTSSTIEGKKIEIEGWRLNSFRFISTEGRVLRNCQIYSSYVLPVTRKFLPENELIDKRAIIHPSKQSER